MECNFKYDIEWPEFLTDSDVYEQNTIKKNLGMICDKYSMLFQQREFLLYLYMSRRSLNQKHEIFNANSEQVGWYSQVVNRATMDVYLQIDEIGGETAIYVKVKNANTAILYEGKPNQQNFQGNRELGVLKQGFSWKFSSEREDFDLRIKPVFRPQYSKIEFSPKKKKKETIAQAHTDFSSKEDHIGLKISGPLTDEQAMIILACALYITDKNTTP